MGYETTTSALEVGKESKGRMTTNPAHSQEKRFILFAGHNYYPQGGANDLIGYFATLEEAVAHVKANAKQITEKVSYYDNCWYNVLNVDTGDAVDGYIKIT
jgi:hypothetical protein